MLLKTIKLKSRQDTLSVELSPLFMRRQAGDAHISKGLKVRTKSLKRHPLLITPFKIRILPQSLLNSLSNGSIRDVGEDDFLIILSSAILFSISAGLASLSVSHRMKLD
jgi:hypothetical protein